MELTRRFAALAALALACSAAPSLAQVEAPRATLLVAQPAFNDVAYRQSVVLLGALQDGGHIGIILNRPTDAYLGGLFPDHPPSRKVLEPLHFGGPFAPGMLVALLQSKGSPGAGTVELVKGLHLVVAQEAVDRVIETTPNDARYYAGMIAWRPGELSAELNKGLWRPVEAGAETIFRKDTGRLWEELLARLQKPPI
jgi:putative AlgH/UPF0301 family transcriptional regulator